MDNMNFKEKIKFFNTYATKQKIKTSNNINSLVKKFSPKKISLASKKIIKILENSKEEVSTIKSNSFDNSYVESSSDPLLSPILFENSIELFDEFKFIHRKYNKDNINNGKKFFKIRYIKKKLDKAKNKYNIEGKFDKENSSLIYSKNFLLILEKAIFSFNQKNIKESYNILQKSEIINSITEFGEFLLAVSGFDKYLIGEFLAKDKPPNDKGEVLKSFINNIDMSHKKISLLEILRFLLNRINLPKDANLILVIMECFTNTFFKMNQNDKEFINIFSNNSDNIYLLISTLLALNTMFTRTDIKNMNQIKKEEFIKMNNSIDSEYLNKLYDELKNKPITMTDDYNETIYQKLTPLILEKTNKNELDNKNMEKLGGSVNKENTFKRTYTIIQEEVDIQNFDTFTIKDEELLLNVNKFYKIKNASSPTIVYILVNEDLSKLVLSKNLENFKIDNFIYLKDINGIYNGMDIAEHSLSIKRYIKSNPNEEKYLNYFISILYNISKETLDLKSDNLENSILWFKALKSLINQINISTENKNITESDEKLKERENLIKDIWYQYIIPKLDKYGNYLLLKKLERTNYFTNLYLEQRVFSKSENFEDKKFYTNKYINSFLEGIQENKRDLDLNEFYFLCDLGIPSSLRKKIYQIIIGNPCYITTELFNLLKQSIKDKSNNFRDLDNKNKNKANKNISNLDEIIYDIFDIYNNIFFVYINQLETKKDKYQLMNSVYIIAKTFFLYRKEISYNKVYIEIIYLFLFIEDNKEDTFIRFVNFFSESNYFLLYGDNEYRKEIINFFNSLLKSKLPNIESHFNQLEIIPELYFIDWMKNFYIETLDISIVLHIFDLLILNGEYILFQTGITILKILEQELMNTTISQALNLLKRLPNKYNKEKFFDVFNSFNNIKIEYVKWKNNKAIDVQKRSLISEK